MAQYQNEYEGIGNSLMNIGDMYYAQSEKRKEEERLRKEKEDERKYLAEQADKEWQRKAPLNLLKEKLVEARTAAAEAQRLKATVQTFTPKTQLLGNIARTTMPNIGPNGEVSYESTDETISPLNPYQPREPRSPYTEVGNQIIDTRTMQPAYTAPATAAKAPGGFTSAQELAARQKVIDAKADRAKEQRSSKHPALDAIIAEREAVYNDIVNARKAPAAGAPSKTTSSALMDAALTGLSAMKYGVSEEAAAAAGMEGKVPAQVVANTLSAQTGQPVSFQGTPSAPLLDAENMPEPRKYVAGNKPEPKKPENPEADKNKETVPTWEAFLAKAKKDAKAKGKEVNEAAAKAYYDKKYGKNR